MEEIEILCSPEQAYHALTDWEERSRWRRGMKIEWQGSAEASVGQEVSFRTEGAFPPVFFSYRIMGLEPPGRIYMEYMNCSLQGRAAMEVTPMEKGCRVSFYWMKVEPKGWITRIYFVLGLGMKSHRHRTMETFRMLKEHLEKKPQR